MSTPRTEVVRQAFARCAWLDSLGYENCASDQRRALTHLEAGLAACQAELAREKELLRDCHGSLDEWRRLLDHSGAQNATHIMRLENVNKILSRITTALAKQEVRK